MSAEKIVSFPKAEATEPSAAAESKERTDKAIAAAKKRNAEAYRKRTEKQKAGALQAAASMADAIHESRRIEITEEEKNQRVMTEAKRLANLSPGEWKLWYRGSAERLGVLPETLAEQVQEQIAVKEKAAREAKAEERRQEQRAEKQRKEEEKRSERKTKEKQKAFASIRKVPTESLQDKEVEKLAKQLGEDSDTLRDEFTAFAGTALESVLGSSEVEGWDVEPWDAQVDTAALLQDLIDKIGKHVVVTHPHEVLAIALWIMFAWVHEVAARHSPYLVATSPEPDSGKSTLTIDVLGWLVPKPFSGAEHTAATVYRTADAHKPTMLFDDVDTLFERKPDLTSIFKIGWKRGVKVPRVETVGRQKVTVWYDPFCPKACNLIGLNMPSPLVGRFIIVKLQPKLPEEHVDEVTGDDETFANLRRKLKRWSDDRAGELKDANPALPAGFTNRVSNNWRLQLAIGELAGGTWPNQTRECAARLSRAIQKPGWRILLLEEFRTILAIGRKEISSEEFVKTITADPLSIWREYNRGGSITQRQVADLLRDLEISPALIGKARISGYRAKDFEEKQIFARYLGRSLV
jgi:hypothetical protein